MKRFSWLIFIILGIILSIIWWYLVFYYPAGSEKKIWENLGSAITSLILLWTFLAATFYGLETRWLREETARRPYPSLLYHKDGGYIELKNYGEGSASNIIIKHQEERVKIPLLSGFSAQRGGVSGKLENIKYKENDEYIIEYKDINEKRKRKFYLTADSNTHDGFWPRN